MKKNNVLYKIEELAHGDKQTKDKLIEILLRQLSEQMQGLQISLVNNDWKEIKRLSHKMMSSFILLKMKRPLTVTKLLKETAGIDIEMTKQRLHELEHICLEIMDTLKNVPEK